MNPHARLGGRHRHCHCSFRQAFTLIELLVTLSIITVLMSLLLPAVMSARGTARGTQCKNNLHNIGLAMIATADTQRRLPASGCYSVNGTLAYRSWVVELLAAMDRADLARRWNFDVPYNLPPNREISDLTLSSFVCPSDDTLLEGRGNLSYVVNGGFGWTSGFPTLDCPVTLHAAEGVPQMLLDLNGNGIACPANLSTDGAPSDKSLYFNTGLFFLENWPHKSGTQRHYNLSSVADGLSNTILLAENVRAGVDPKLPDASWACPVPTFHSFFVSGYVCPGGKCASGSVDYRKANDRSDPQARWEAINSSRTQAEGEAPWPSSNHPGGVHVAFADGRVHFLSEQVEGSVYACLVSPQGTTVRGPLEQPILSGAGY